MAYTYLGQSLLVSPTVSSSVWGVLQSADRGVLHHAWDIVGGPTSQ